MTRAFQQLKFKFLDKVNSDFACSVGKDGRLEGFWLYLRRIWRAVEGDGGAKSDATARDFGDELIRRTGRQKHEWSAIERDMMKWAVPKLGGAASPGLFSIAFEVVDLS